MGPTSAAESTQKPCQRCTDKDAIVGEKFCLTCRRLTLKEMLESGYLKSPYPPKSTSEHFGRKARSSRVLSGVPGDLDNDDDADE